MTTSTHLQNITACFDAQTSRGRLNEYKNGDLNPDIGGALVALANIVINFLLPFLVAFAPDTAPDSSEPARTPGPSTSAGTTSAESVLASDGAPGPSTSTAPPPLGYPPKPSISTAPPPSIRSPPSPRNSIHEPPARFMTPLISPPEVSASVLLLYSQTIPILLATLASIKSDNLTVLDAHFALSVTASPMSVYLAITAILRLVFKEDTSLYAKIRSSEAKIIILGFGLLLPALWLSISFVLSFATTAFSNSDLCAHMEFDLYVKFLIASSMFGFLDVMGQRDLHDDFPKRKGLGLICLLTFWISGIYIVRHLKDIAEDLRTRVGPVRDVNEVQHGHTRRFWRFVLRTPGACWRSIRFMLFVLHTPRACWQVVTNKHPAVLVMVVLCMHLSWLLGILKTTGTDFRNTQYSYGQILSIFSFVPALYSFCKILYRNWRSIRSSIRRIPGYVADELSYLITGESDLPKNQVKSIILCVGFVVLNVAHIVYIYFYVFGGTHANDRNGTTRPHKNWKPFSILLYMSGYIVSILNVYISIYFFDYFSEWLKTSSYLFRTFHFMASFLIGALRLTVFILLGTFVCAYPLFAPFISLPLSQQWHYSHLCDSWPSEIILYGKSDISASSLISFYTKDPQYPTRKQHIYDFAFFNVSEYKIITYRPINNLTLPKELEPSVKTVFLNMSQRNFSACSSTFNDTTLRDPNLHPALMCSDVLGSYNETPYLKFAITTSSSLSHLQLGDKEYRFIIDAPAFSLRFIDGSLTDTVLLRSALTKRNTPSTLKACYNAGAASAEVLGPLGVFMDALNEHAIYISRDRLYSFL